MPRDHRTLHITTTWDGQPVDATEAVSVELSKDEQGVRVRVSAPFHGDDAPPGLPASTDRLWEYEVVEVMFADDGDRYLEVELSPHGHWLCLCLHGVRRPISTGHALDHRAHIAGARWTGDAWIPNALLPSGWCRVNAFAIHGAGQGRRYLAHRPAGGAAPDFHVLGVFEPW